MKTSIATSSIKSHIFNSTSMLNTSTQRPSSKELEMSTSIEDQELSSRVSESQIGLLLRKDTVGNSTLTQDKLGKTLFMTSTQNGLPCNSLVRDKSQTLLNGSDSNNGVRVYPQDCSTTKYQSQLMPDTVVTLMKLRSQSTLSLMPIKNTSSFSVLTPPPQRVELNSRRNGKLFHKLPQNFFPKKIWYIHMRWLLQFQASHISEESGNSTENICSRLDSPFLTNKVKLQMKT